MLTRNALAFMVDRYNYCLGVTIGFFGLLRSRRTGEIFGLRPFPSRILMVKMGEFGFN